MMLSTLYFVSSLVLALGLPSSRSLYQLDGRIVGGQPVNIEDYPHQISLQWQGGHICGGSILNENFILTAAHCTAGKPPSEFSIRANTSLVNEGGTVINVLTINQHPDFNYFIADADMSILELTQPLTLGVGANPIGLPALAEEIAVGTEVIASRWGYLEEGGSSLSTQLQAVTINVVDDVACQDAYFGSNITSYMLCAGVPEGGKDSCQGDSGGPLIFGNIIYGVVSWGNGCARPGVPGVYADVAALRQFITDITGL